MEMHRVEANLFGGEDDEDEDDEEEDYEDEVQDDYDDSGEDDDCDEDDDNNVEVDHNLILVVLTSHHSMRKYQGFTDKVFGDKTVMKYLLFKSFTPFGKNQ